mmetsp:Transcript_16291/g.21422  ORF Transcript_16291/g.21422 Transcript_16291/m.21422 type:complete len:395 (-) Transcript_16291:1226-2410(-)
MKPVSEASSREMLERIATAFIQQQEATEDLLKSLKVVIAAVSECEKDRKTFPALRKLKKLLKRILKTTGQDEEQSEVKQVKKLTKNATALVTKLEGAITSNSSENIVKETPKNSKNNGAEAREDNITKKDGKKDVVAPIKKAALSMASFSDLITMLKKNEGQVENTLALLDYLKSYRVRRSELESTGAGKYINSLRKSNDKRVAFASKKVVLAWKESVEESSKKSKKDDKARSKTASLAPKNSKFARVAKTDGSDGGGLLKQENSKFARAPKGSEKISRVAKAQESLKNSKKRGRAPSKERDKERDRQRNRGRDRSQDKRKDRHDYTKRRGEGTKRGEYRPRRQIDDDVDEVDEHFDEWMRQKRKRLREGFERVQAEEDFSQYVADEDDRNAVL